MLRTMKRMSILAVISLFIGSINIEAQVVADTTSMINLDEVIVLSSYAKNSLDKPVALSTINSEEIGLKLSNKEFPELLNSTPSVYTTRQGGGFGDARLTLRGFSSDNVALLINGVPVTGMENSAIYWSNWAGLSDVAYSMQVQRGIGLSKMGVFSVGGTINVLTNSAAVDAGGWLYAGIGNNGYNKEGFSLSTGRLANGWAVTISGSHTSGNGYVNGTNFEMWNYFANVTKYINSHHTLSFMAFGAPQWHNRRSNKQMIEDYDANRDGIRMNTCYGYLNGKVLSTYSGYNKYHKPQISLSHYWHINDKSDLNTSLYLSWARGGGRKIYGNSAYSNMIQYNYKNGKPNYDKNGNIVTSLTPDGLIDYSPLMNINANSETGSKAVFTMGTNSHNSYGLISNFSHRFNKEMNLTAGIDMRLYRAYHYEEISDLLGGSYFMDSSLAWREPNSKLGVGDKVNSDYFSDVSWFSAFSQFEYNRDSYQTYISASVANHNYRRTDNGHYGLYSDQSKYPADMYRTKWRSFVPVSVKGGFNYHFTKEHRAFVNAGYVTRAPLLDNVYNYNVELGNAKNEKIVTAEVGYTFLLSNLNITFNGYYTRWFDKSTVKAIGSWSGPKTCIPDIDAEHKGLELEINYKPVQSLKLKAFATVAEYKWLNDVSFTYIDENNNVVGTYNAYIKGLHVGNAPQTSAYVGADWECLKNLVIGANFNYYGRQYADFTASDRTDETDRNDSWRMPDFCTVDASLNYKIKINKSDNVLQLFANVNNLFNKKYISDATDGAKHDRETATVWYGFGTTWTVGVKFSF